MTIYRLNAWWHPVRACVIALRKLLQNRDLNDPLWDGGTVPPALARFTPGEVLPWKGVQFKVGKVVGGPMPCVILVPVGATKNRHLHTLRVYRDLARAARREA